MLGVTFANSSSVSTQTAKTKALLGRSSQNVSSKFACRRGLSPAENIIQTLFAESHAFDFFASFVKKEPAQHMLASEQRLNLLSCSCADRNKCVFAFGAFGKCSDFSTFRAVCKGTTSFLVFGRCPKNSQFDFPSEALQASRPFRSLVGIPSKKSKQCFQQFVTL